MAAVEQYGLRAEQCSTALDARRRDQRVTQAADDQRGQLQAAQLLGRPPVAQRGLCIEGGRQLLGKTAADQRLMGQISAESGAKLGGKLYTDSLSKPEGPAGTSIEMLAYNVATIAKAFTV